VAKTRSGALDDKLEQPVSPLARIEATLADFDGAEPREWADLEPRLLSALEIARVLDDPESICRVCTRLCNLYLQLDRFSEVDRTLGVFSAAAARTEDRKLKGSYCYVSATRLHTRDRYEEAAPIVAECIGHWTAEGYAQGLCAAFDMLGSVALMQGRPAEALGNYRRSLELVSAEDRYGRAVALCNIGLALRAMGRWEDAVESVYQSLAAAEAGGHVEQRTNALESLGEMFSRRGKLTRATELFRQALGLYSESGIGADNARESYIGLADALRRQGDLAQAEQILAESEPLIVSGGRPYHRSRLLTSQAEIAHAEGRLTEAAARAGESSQLAAAHGLRPQQAEALRVWALVLQAEGDQQRALAAYEDAERLLSAGEDSFELARVRMQHGLLLVDRGEPAVGRHLLQSAGRVFRRLSATAESGEVSRALFRLDLSTDSEVALLQGVSGLVSLGLDPQVFVTRAIELLLAGLEFSSGVLFIARQPSIVVGTPDLDRARLAADACDLTSTDQALVLPVSYQGRRLGVLYLDRPEPLMRAPRSTILDTLVSLLAPMVQRVAEMTASVAAAAAESAELEGLRYTGVVGRSTAMREVLATVARVAGSNVSVLIRGESGTGKELVARALHESSARAGAPFVAVNCAALPEALMEAEFFGVEKGAATGVVARKGRFEQAHKGTIFLDEIAEMSPALQAKLLRVVQDKVVERVGGHKPMSVDVRVITATNQEIGVLISEGRFRQDLYYRLNTVELSLPPLRERVEDIPALVSYFIRRADEEFGKGVAGCDATALEALLRHGWPGNIRELQHVVERAVLMAEGGSIVLQSLPPALRHEAAAPRVTVGRGPRTRGSRAAAEPDAAERSALIDCLDRAGWQVNRAAELAGYSRAQFYRLLRRHGIKRPSG
jgi:transcriptional regulator with GAF, ATPase, and Fis domain/tetratricopeptide (TPR) repeat protein